MTTCACTGACRVPGGRCPSAQVGYHHFEPFVQQGWQCPVCKSVYSPTMVQCLKCPTQTITSYEITSEVYK